MRRRSVVAIGAAVLAAAGLVAAAVLGFPAGTVGRTAAGQIHLPVTLEGAVFQSCMPTTDEPLSTGAYQSLAFTTRGSGGSFSASVEVPGAWHVDAGRAGVTIVEEHGTRSPDGPVAPTPAAVALAQHLYSCLAPYRFVDETTHEATSSQLVQWYKYDVLVLWPCLAAHGLQVGDPPTRADFSDPFRAQSVNPYQDGEIGKLSLHRLLTAVQECPMRPPFLR